MALIKRVGYGQVEPNHLSAQVNGQIYAQLPAKKNITVLEQGQFVKYDYATGEVNYTGPGEWMLVYNEEKLYDVLSGSGRKDFALKSKDFDGGIMTPRVFKTMIGDIYTTNTFGEPNGEGLELAVKDLLKVDAATGKLVKESVQLSESTETMLWQVVKVYTMPDGQPGVKIMRIK